MKQKYLMWLQVSHPGNEKLHFSTEGIPYFKSHYYHFAALQLANKAIKQRLHFSVY